MIDELYTYSYINQHRANWLNKKYIIPTNSKLLYTIIHIIANKNG